MSKYPAGTLGYLLEGGYKIALHCEAPGCHHFAWADLPKLVEKLGPEHGYLAADLNGKFQCTKCGSRRVGIRLHPSGKPHEGNPAVAYIVPPKIR